MSIEERLTALEARLDALEARQGRFSKPDRESVNAEFAKAGMPFTEAEKFWNHYEANGWKVGKVPMKSWKAAITNWRLNYESRGTSKPGIWAVKQQLDAVNQAISSLEAGNALKSRDGALVWMFPDKQVEYGKLVAKREELNRQLLQ